MRLLRIGSMEDFLTSISEPYPYQTPLEKAKGDGAFVCHTSGTTGIPKPCIYTHEFMLRMARTMLLTPPSGYTSLQSLLGHNVQILLLPLFHPAGVQLAILNAVFNRCVVIIPSWTAPPSIESLLAISRNVKADWAMASPFTLEALAKDEAMLDEIASQLKLLVFAGGSLPKMLGDVIAKKIRLVSFLGSSETAGLPVIYPDEFDSSENWEYMMFHPKISASLQPQTADSFELVLEKSTSAQMYQPIFDRFPQLNKFRTGDLFKKHPTRSNMWAHASRADDIIVFLNGEKTNPVSFENHLTKHRDIEAAIVFGDQRFEAGVLIELKAGRSPQSPEDMANYVKGLWPIIEQANQDAPAHARITTSHVLFTNPEKPFLRTPKGTVMRKATLDRYADEIDKLYQDVESIHDGPSDNSEGKVDLNDLGAVLAVVQAACEESTTLQGIDANDDILASGVDSLQIMRLCRNLRSKTGVGDLKPAMIYSNPTPVALAKVIQKVAKGNRRLSDEQQTLDRSARLEEYLASYIRGIDEIAATQPQTTSKEKRGAIPTSHTCIITGTTGTIGAYILRALMAHDQVDTIYCLNRGPDSASRQAVNNAEVDAHLPTTFPKTVHFIEADISHDTFNIELELFETLSSSATLIIHNAWPVDFNLPLSAFTKHLAGVKNLCKFSTQGTHRPAIMFLSSVSAVMGLAFNSDKPVPEEIFDDPSVTVENGYAESKYLAERIVKHAAGSLHIPVIVARIGQVCGAIRSPGRWNPKEWVPRLITSSIDLGIIPDSLGTYDAGIQDVDWIPVDVLADALIEILLKGQTNTSSQGQPGRLEVYHLMNPKRTSWATLLPAIVEMSKNSKPRSTKYGSGDATSLSIVTREKWLETLHDSANNLDSAHGGRQISTDISPALKLLDFYEDKLAENVFAQFDMADAVSSSTVLQQIESISLKDMRQWVRLWHKDSAVS